MFRKLIKKLVKVLNTHRLAHKDLLRQEHNNTVIFSILKDLEERH